MVKKLKKTTLKRGQICDKCGFKNRPHSVQCSQCSSKKFAPHWVLAKYPINRQVSIEITKGNPEYAGPEKRLTLYKWWPGGRASFNISKPDQWQSIKQVIDQRLAPMLGWIKKSDAKEIVLNQAKEEKRDQKNINRVVAQDPDLVGKLLGALSSKHLSNYDISQISEIIGKLADVAPTLDAGFKDSFLKLVAELPKQKKRALEDLEELLKTWTLNQVTAATSEVKRRMETISLLKKQIMDSRTYEIIGQNSIHRILERAMWLIDERYWLLHSNETIRKIVGEKLGKIDRKKYGNRRPDFACGTVGEKLIIVEIKRPSHKLVISDLNQLEDYVTIAEKHLEFKSFEGYLIGSEIDLDLKSRLKRRSNDFRIKTYADLLDSAEKRYKEFLREA